MPKDQGACVCEKIKFTVKDRSNAVGVCHCDTCRKWGGGPFMEVHCGTEVHFTGEENLGVFDSSPWAERGFCKNCGTHLFYRLKQTQEYLMLAGLFSDHNLEMTNQVFIDKKPAYYSFVEHTTNMTGQQMFDKYNNG